MKENDIIKDRYRLLRPLGSGGFGEVWLAKDMKTHTDCALKFYVRLDDKGREEFSSEYSRMLGISHPNLLTAKYYDEWQGRPFLVMNYCGGGAASDRVGQLGEMELWRLIRDVASGLACLHSQRDTQGKEAPVIHQDIKPANFLQKDDGTWLISDFGISSRMRSSMSSQSGREVSSGGTIPYMGPERFDRMLVKASDIWSIGASIYEMATGDVPFGEFGGGTQRAGAGIPHLPRERWSSNLDRLVSSCLQKETWDRPSAALVAEYADCKLKGKPLPELPREDQAQQQAQTSSQTNSNTSGASFRGTANGHEWVDLGLPSGTLWAICNIGASSPEGYGDYFAWGETQSKDIYNVKIYKYAEGWLSKLTKYCSDSLYGSKAGNEGILKLIGRGFTDSLTELQTGDDPATANWGSGWRTPNEAQWDELLANTTDQWTTKNGVKGMLFTSKKNGQSVFLPAAGGRWFSKLRNAGSHGRYWSRSLYTGSPSFAWSLDFYSDNCLMKGYGRNGGFSVRPVREK